MQLEVPTTVTRALLVWTAIGIVLASMPARGADQCYETSKLYGAMMRASLFCNFPWQPALDKAVAVLREVCPAPSEEAFKKAMRPGVEEGFRVFERDRQRHGDKKACADWDKFVRAISTYREGR